MKAALAGLGVLVMVGCGSGEADEPSASAVSAPVAVVAPVAPVAPAPVAAAAASEQPAPARLTLDEQLALLHAQHEVAFGPDVRVRFRVQGPAIVNVWPASCDKAPAARWKAFRKRLPASTKVVNVAVGLDNPTQAADVGDDPLLFEPIVREERDGPPREVQFAAVTTFAIDPDGLAVWHAPPDGEIDRAALLHALEQRPYVRRGGQGGLMMGVAPPPDVVAIPVTVRSGDGTMTEGYGSAPEADDTATLTKIVAMLKRHPRFKDDPILVRSVAVGEAYLGHKAGAAAALARYREMLPSATDFDVVADLVARGPAARPQP